MAKKFTVNMWSAIQKKYLKEQWGRLSAKTIAEHIGRSEWAVTQRAYSMGLMKKKPTAKEVE